MDNFETALAEVLKDEGGYVNHPKDPGGATNKGVTQRVYDNFRLRNGLSTKDVRFISDAEVASIYRAGYWDLGKCGRLPVGVSYVVFDGNVNSGVKQSVKWLQRALGFTGAAVDGLIGETTIAAAKAYPDKAQLVDRICDLRLAFLKALKTWPTFGKGWSRRVERVRRIGREWARGNVATETSVVPGVGATAKAYVSDVKAAPSAAVGDVLAGVGGSSVVISQTIDKAVEQLTPYANIGIVSNILLGLTLAGAVVGIGGILYRTWATIKGRQIKEATQTAVPA